MKNKFLILITIFTLSLTCIANAESLNLSDSLKNMEEMINHIDENYYLDINKDDLIYAAYNGVFNELDEHSTYFKPEQYREFKKQISGEYVGLGILVQEDNGYILITDIFKNSPAEKANLKIWDKIVTINGISVRSVGYEKAINMLLGEAESTVSIGVKRGNNSQAVYYNIVRTVIDINPIDYELLENNIGYIKLKEFSSGAYFHFNQAVVDLQLQGAEALIVDVRNNLGGLINEAIEIAEFFTPLDFPILYVKSKTKEDVINSIREPINIPTVILVNENSASASEILAGVIKDNKTGIVIGTNTYGKGTAQNFIDLENGNKGGYKVTFAQFFTTNHSEIPVGGLVPDIYVKNVNDSLKLIIEKFQELPTDSKAKLGDISISVYALEQRLEILGYKVDVDGTFALDTKNAVNLFQKDYKIEGLGLVNEETITRLDAICNSLKEQYIGDLQIEKAVEYLMSN